MKTHPVFPILLALLVLALPVPAQVSGRLTGSVVDSTGAVVPGGIVEVFLAGGNKAVLTATTNQDGLFDLAGIRPDYYDVSVTAKGFRKYVLRRVKVDPAQQALLPTITLEVAATSETVEVVANADSVQTANAEITTTVSQAQVMNLPVLDRQVSGLFLTQAGVSTGRGPTVIDGLRTSMANVTLDGVNIQDNFIRTNALDYLPNKLTISQVGEFSVNTSNANTAAGGGGAQVTLITPSGTNQFHGEGYWYNRNNRLASNDWFNDKNGIEKPGLNLNQLGGGLGGPIFKDKLFFYGNYEAYRYKATSPTNYTVLTPSARNGIFSYTNAAGATQTVNILNARHLTIDPAIQNILSLLPATPNNFELGDGLNSGGYSFNARNNETRDNVLVKLDYNHSVKHTFSGEYIWNRDLVDRPDIGPFFTKVPPVYNNNWANFVSAGWRWNPTPNLTNEVRGGFNLSPGSFNVRTPYATYLVDNSTTVWDSPVNTFMAQGRTTNTYNLNDNGSWVRGKHTIAFGMQTQQIRTAPYNDAGMVPTYGLGFGTGNSQGLTNTDLPGVSAADLGTANALLANLAGFVSTYTQTFNVTSRTSGFVGNATNLRHFSFNTYAPYVSDTWRVRRNLTLVLGMRWEYYTRLDDRDSLELLPQIQGNFISTLLNPNATLDFAGSSVGRPFYNRDLNNFGPNVGLAWDVFGDHKTSLRAGYSIFYANDDTITAVRNNIVTNSGLSAVSSGAISTVATLTGSLPAVPVPTFKVPRTVTDNFLLAPTSNAVGLPDPSLRTPYVQEWNLSVEREVAKVIVKARYVGNHLVKGLRAFDYNQVNINASGFLGDFQKAQSNGFLALAAGKGFDPRYNSAIAGSQPLTIFATMPNGGYLTNSSVKGYIQRGEVGTLGQFYFTNKVNGPIQFFNNPASLGTNTISSYSNSTYNAFQFDVTRRVSDVWLQGNYTFGKVLSDAAGDGQTRFEPFLDNANPKVERARAPFDLTHVLKLVYSVPLPMGPGKRLSYGPLNRVLGGWSLSGFVTYQSGTPFSILSTRGTLNRGSRSTLNTATTALTKSQLDSVVGFLMTGDGPTFISPSALGPDGRGVATDGAAAFSGQVFFNPAAGTIGTLQRRMFSGPWFFNWDASISKETRLFEHHSIQIRADFFNLTNHPNFYVGNESSSTTNFNINSATFGKITSTLNAPRVVQFGLRYKF